MSILRCKIEKNLGYCLLAYGTILHTQLYLDVDLSFSVHVKGPDIWGNIISLKLLSHNDEMVWEKVWPFCLL